VGSRRRPGEQPASSGSWSRNEARSGRGLRRSPTRVNVTQIASRGCVELMPSFRARGASDCQSREHSGFSCFTPSDPNTPFNSPCGIMRVTGPRVTSYDNIDFRSRRAPASGKLKR